MVHGFLMRPSVDARVYLSAPNENAEIENADGSIFG